MHIKKLEKLDQLQTLLVSGALSESEFDQEKAKLLKRPPVWLYFTGIIALALVGVSAAEYGSKITDLSATASNMLSSGKLAVEGDTPSASGESQTFKRLTLSEVVSPSVLGGSLDDLERIAGAGKPTDAIHRVFTIGRCAVTAQIWDHKVVSLSIPAEKKCSVNLGRFVPGLGHSDRLTVGKLGSEARFESDCIGSCTNAHDATGELSKRFGSTERNITVGGTVDLEENGDDEEKIVDMMKTEAGQDYIDNAAFNCDHMFDGPVSRILKDARFTQVHIDAPIRPTSTLCGANPE